MEHNNQWVEDRLAKLNPEENWQPQVSAARARLEARLERRSVFGPRVLSVAALAAICVVTFPQPRALAQRMVTPCLEACQSLVMSPGDIHDDLHWLMWTFHNWLGFAPPDFEASDAVGAKFRLSDSMGKVILLNFWASWCAPCKTEIPWFVEFQHTYGNKDFAVIGVSMDEDGWKAVRPVMESQKVNYRVAIGDRELAQKYGGLESLPQTMLLDRKGRLLVKHTGITSKDQYEREIVRALWSELSPADRDRLRAQGFH